MPPSRLSPPEGKEDLLCYSGAALTFSLLPLSDLSYTRANGKASLDAYSTDPPIRPVSDVPPRYITRRPEAQTLIKAAYPHALSDLPLHHQPLPTVHFIDAWPYTPCLHCHHGFHKLTFTPHLNLCEIADLKLLWHNPSASQCRRHGSLSQRLQD
jgi:hypothetical protein